MAELPPEELLHRIADAYGVAPKYWSFSGQCVKVQPDTLVRILAAMGVDASTEGATRVALEYAEHRQWRKVLPSTTVVRQGNEYTVQVHVPHGAQVALHIITEEGERVEVRQAEDYEQPRMIDGIQTGQASFVVPSTLPLGYHTICAQVTVPGAQESHDYEEALIVVPQRLPSPQETETSGWGAMGQLYSLRSRESWGIGDTADLCELLSMWGSFGAQFFLINPLHAAEPSAPMTPSPYLPVSRRFFNPIYIRPEDIREVAYMDSAQRAIISWAGEPVKQSSLRNTEIDRDAVWKAKKSALEVIFKLPRSQARQRGFELYRKNEGQGLENFAFWCALYEKYGHDFPANLSSPTTPDALALKPQLAERIEFFAWLQWIIDQQLAQAQRSAHVAGMKIGVMHDLAVGVQRQGSDVWGNPDVFARGVSAGAPPDMYNQFGQNWSPPPFNPIELDNQHYAPVRNMARTVLRHSGCLRIDHVMGFFRLWWIPEGEQAANGAYVYYNHEAMIGVLMLEAYRAGAFLIGEDLGNVEPWVREFLTERGIFGTSVMLFEKDGEEFRSTEQYKSATLVTVDTHDLPPLAGYLAGEHVDLRAQLGALVEPEDKVRQEADREREKLVETLQHKGFVGDNPTEREIIEAMYRFIAQTPAQLQAIAVVDAVGERRSQNVPGTHLEYPNWKIPLADGTEEVVLLEDMSEHPRLHSLLDAYRKEYERAHGE
ncbi:4-alpha-glucanotransferase [Actinotignum urinale]|uniref:4-alpha-glucanotransferase n=1 Tax=Actinotignum urinale TaxID=190146 RepID=A0AAW9I0J2_9ACTO|nr:4-alpha-glucanotransferase [Actinotignum urinale]MDY5155591.1 4-alpha-glucanotransferase [Actinotignum urinale]